MADLARHPFVAVSEKVTPKAGREANDWALIGRLGAVDQRPGFRGLEVLAVPAGEHQPRARECWRFEVVAG